MRKLLITGVSGFLGWNICQWVRSSPNLNLLNTNLSEWQIHGACFSHKIEIPTVTLHQINLTDFSALQDLFRIVQPDAVIHAAAQSKPNYCQLHPEETYPINVTASNNIAGLCSDRAIPCAFTSTDLVFDGLNPPYKETDPVNPVSYYGEQKVLAEEGMLKRYPQAAICRMPLMFGRPSPVANSFIQSFIKALQTNQSLNIFTDEWRTSVSGTTAAHGLLLALNHAEGVLHLGGRERLSRYEFVQLMATVFNLPTTGIHPCRQQDVQMPAPRPADVSLDSSKAFALGYQPLSLKEELEALKDLL
ncbi:MAG: SDR family oxidoreductase [Microcoleaceae cyanobacterium]